MAYVDPIPANYDASSIDVDPGGLSSAAKALLAHITDISGFIDDIGTTLSGLNLSWSGASAQAMSKYNDEWSRAVESLLGTQLDPGAGALNIVYAALGGAAQNYSHVELSVAGGFNRFAGGFAGLPVPYRRTREPTGSSSPSLAPVDDPTYQVDGEWLYHTTAVDETGASAANNVMH